ncbi:MAG: leucine-rich repeat protein [Clostridia bacterium]|nr:leucine-rich repeat protein [Clostridia bacterium]
MKKRIISLLLVLALSLSALGIGGFALEESHSYDHDADASCNTCGATRTAPISLSYDGDRLTATVTYVLPTATEVAIPNTVEYNGNTYEVSTIDSNAFSAATALQTLSIPKSISSYEIKTAVNACPALVAVNVDPENRSCSSVDGVLYNKSQTTLERYPRAKAGAFTVPQSVSTISSGAFKNCTALTAVDLPDGLTSVKDFTFEGCTALREIYLPVSLKSVGYNAFRRCTFTTVRYGGTPADRLTMTFDTTYAVPVIEVPWIYTYSADAPVHQYDHSLDPTCNTCGETRTLPLTLSYDEATLTATVTACAKVESEVVVPAAATHEGKIYAITAIGENAFSDCFCLKSVSLPDTIETFGNSAFSDCVAMESFTVPSKVTVIPFGLFGSCVSLKSVVLHDQITTIGNLVFAECTSLAEITLPKQLKSIGLQALSNTAIKTLAIPEGMTTLKSGLLIKCGKLETLMLPASLESIADSVTNHCGSLKTVYFCGTKEQADQLSISSSNDPLKSATWYCKGDLNNDGVTTTADISLMLKTFQGANYTLDPYAADCNSDGSISLADALRLLKLLSV